MANPLARSVRIHIIKYFKEKKINAEIKYFDMETVEGLTEGAFHEVGDIPTVIIFDNKDELTRWVKRPPVSEDFLPYLIEQIPNNF